MGCRRSEESTGDAGLRCRRSWPRSVDGGTFKHERNIANVRRVLYEQSNDDASDTNDDDVMQTLDVGVVIGMYTGTSDLNGTYRAQESCIPALEPAEQRPLQL